MILFFNIVFVIQKTCLFLQPFLKRTFSIFFDKRQKNLYLCRPCTGFTPEKKVTETRQKFLKDILSAGAYGEGGFLIGEM